MDFQVAQMYLKFHFLQSFSVFQGLQLFVQSNILISLI